MNSKKILEKGFFPKELPPPFETKEFAEKARRIRTQWRSIENRQKIPIGTETAKHAKVRANSWFNARYFSSKIVKFNYPKDQYSRRRLSIPNPMHFLQLVDEISSRWTYLRENFKLSQYSASYPVELDAKRALRTKSKTLNDFKFLLAEKATNRKVELRIDISQFYPSIYTHTIAWALMGKEEAKKAFKTKRRTPRVWNALLRANDPTAINYKFAETLDTKVRNCNERQSVGIPIGPDTSFIIAEIIGNRIDHEIQQRLTDVDHDAIRYFDDYYFYLNNKADSELVGSVVQQVLHKFELDINASKVTEDSIPFKSLEEEWVPRLSNFSFNTVNKYELRGYFSLLFRLQAKNKDHSSWLVNYSLMRFEYGDVRVNREAWPVFLNLLLQTLYAEPGNIHQIFKIILTYENYLTNTYKKKIATTLEKILNEHIELDHSFEVSWALWALKSFRIKCPRELLSRVLSSNDNVSRLIALNLISDGLYTGQKPGLSKLGRSVSSKDLSNENWLFAYESYRKSWLNIPTVNFTSDHEFIELLFNHGVYFYKENNQLLPEFDLNTPREKGGGGHFGGGGGGGWYAGHANIEDLEDDVEELEEEIDENDIDDDLPF